MKVRLFNDAGYGDMEEVSFPAIVKARVFHGVFLVNASELYRIGANPGTFGGLDDWAFVKNVHAVEALRFFLVSGDGLLTEMMMEAIKLCLLCYSSFGRAR
ncbi:hypothetical protein GH714_044100 [Hevea brasiliensis]|uniref:Uncharacterized protein n=1 Tax=Hevea brasiliensis TaxID=3981 RepID=A0A6A6K1T9_HEVBR|nr:hypothetical protein GH714_044100 [Hevea brasiliensis]